LARSDRNPLRAIALASKRSAAPFCALLVVSSCLAPARAQSVGGCPTFPANNIWNTPVDGLPLDAKSTDYVNTIGGSKNVHADFGSGLWEGTPIGIPYVLVDNQPAVTVQFDYADESDPGPYPIPPDPPIEGGGDHHILIVDQANCHLYELYAAERQPDGSWTAGSGAIFDLRSNQLRPAGWTSADAAGLPILPGLARYEEVLAGEIRHALRFTAPHTRAAYVWPARHLASDLTGSQDPPMGQRFRLRASFDISRFSPVNQVILRALKKYGMLLADNGSSWYISGAPDSRWDNDDLHALDPIAGSDFEAVDSSSLMVSPDSAAAGSADALAPAISSVVNTASSLPGIAPGTWISILGANLAPAARAWRNEEIVNGALPASLDGVSVTVDGRPAALCYIGPGQVNAQAPDDDATGTVEVAVTNAHGTGRATAALQTFAPAFFLAGGRYVLAQHADYSLVGPTPAKPGEVIVLYGAGFGPTSPRTPSGRVVSQASPLANLASLTVRIGGVTAEVQSAGIALAGIWQIGVRVPASVPGGDALVEAEIGGQHTQASAFIRVQRP
jgi:uncharacterized protein (TIGR03437 family)